MRVRIIEGCIVCKQCECQAPDVFVVDEKSHSARVVEDSPTLDRELDVIAAVKGCPVHVIKLKRDPKTVRDAFAAGVGSVEGGGS
jgi:ferredoxin